jgi:hypothetical protein
VNPTWPIQRQKGRSDFMEALQMKRGLFSHYGACLRVSRWRWTTIGRGAAFGCLLLGQAASIPDTGGIRRPIERFVGDLLRATAANNATCRIFHSLSSMKSAEFARADAGGIFERKASCPERSGSIHHLGAA